MFHEDHIFPETEFGVRKLKKRGYDDEVIQRYLAVYNTVLNLERLTDTETLSKNATPFDQWIVTRDAGFKRRHLIPELKSYGLHRGAARAHRRHHLHQLLHPQLAARRCHGDIRRDRRPRGGGPL